MQKKTYLQEGLRNGRIVRWIDSCMPLKFYVAPFNFYSKQGEDYKYKALALKALNTWQNASAGKISFVVVNTLLESQINLNWKRVDRQALGNCYFSFDAQNRLFSAEIQIGISDGLIHRDYMDEGEVYHTILHEIGHAIGLGHSPFEDSIMHSPHRYGVVNLSKSDELTLRWLYRLPINSTVADVASKYNVPSSNLDEITAKLIEKNTPSEFEKVKNSIVQNQKDLLTEQERIAELKRYNLSLQNIKISEDMRKAFINQNFNKK